MVFFSDNIFINFFCKEALEKLGGFIPKEGKYSNIGENNCQQNYWRISLYANQNIDEMQRCANFNYEILKLSFNDLYHDIRVDNTINIALEYINYFDKSSDYKYLEIADDLIQRYLIEFPKNDIAKINFYQIKLRQISKLSDEEIEEVLNILEKAEKSKEDNICFACEILLQNKLKARRLFNLLDKKEQDTLKNYPIFHLYKNMK